MSLDLKREAALLDHTVVRDRGGADRWTCTRCDLSIEMEGVIVTGHAATTWCPGVRVPADDSRGASRG